ncbi:MAG: pyruvate:ferredoxin (flavodoxin) oxidoreductase [Alphaproteobacteria bacterium]|nr:pyruvate:ferredoxin (flavodoxin) oxidoreductase [Alphaproteobacteria bacterium]
MSEMKTLDGCEAAASVAYRLNETSIIYPITPSSPMGEFADTWAANEEKNIFGNNHQVVEMQSEAGAAGAVHGSLMAGSLTTTYTASQGLLLMLPNMYKIAGELTPFVMHVAARSIAYSSLSIFGDHSDVMAVRQAGFAMLSSNSVQEAHDMAAIANMATLKSRVPFLHFFDGFRTSHEISKIEMISNDQLRELIDADKIKEFKSRCLTPDTPTLRGTAQNPDTYFQSREAANKYYDLALEETQKAMDKFSTVVGRKYNLVDYIGPEDAEKVIVVMGSAAEAIEETINYMNSNMGTKLGLLKVRLYRPFPKDAFIKALPETAKKIAVLDRTKESGSIGEPLYLDIVSVLEENNIKDRAIIGGRYGLSSKEFNPAMIKAIYDELDKSEPKKHFTIGINDDVTNTSLDYDANFHVKDDKVNKAIFYGLGSDGTVGANKNSIKIIGGSTDNYAQAYFIYDSKKSGGITCSHLRFSPEVIKSSYAINQANFVACHQFNFLEKIDVLSRAAEGATFLLNSPYSAKDVWDKLPRMVQSQIIDKKLDFYVIDALPVAKKAQMGTRINTIMQTCYFALANIIEKDKAIELIKESIQKTYGKKSQTLVERNFAAVDGTLENLEKVEVPAEATSEIEMKLPVPADAPDFVRDVIGKMIEGKGDDLPVSAMPADGVWPTATSKYEKRDIAPEVPVWMPEHCIACGMCSFVCPHSAIRTKFVTDEEAAKLEAEGMQVIQPRGTDKKFVVQVSPEDCTGCGLCVHACLGKNRENPEEKAINMQNKLDVVAKESAQFKCFSQLPENKASENPPTIAGVSSLQPYMEYSGACAGCGETPYIKLITQLFGDRMFIANATGCSSIYGGNLPTTPYCKDENGRGPAWANSLFEDNAEFGMGMRVAVNGKKAQAERLVKEYCNCEDILTADQSTEEGIEAQRERVNQLKEKLANDSSELAKELLEVADYLVKKSVWIIGGDGWAYDIGYGGLDHVLNSGENVNIMVMDNEVYANTGGQASKATPIGASAKFAAAGKDRTKKDMGLESMIHGNVFVAKIAFGANPMQAIKAIKEAEAFDGPSIILAYSHCIAHGYTLGDGLTHQKEAVAAGHWQLYRYSPVNGLAMDSRAPNGKLAEYMQKETRFKIAEKKDKDRYDALAEKAAKDAENKFKIFDYIANFGKEAK